MKSDSTNNILHLMGMDSTKYGGIERFNVQLSQQLAEKGFHSVFVYERWPDVEQFVDDIKATGAEIVVINSRRNPITFCRNFWKLLRRHDFCMMHAHFTKARFYAIPLALLHGIKNIVYTFHSTVPPLVKIKFHTRAWYAMFNKYCRVVAVSEEIEEVSKQNWPDIAIKNLYMGIVPVKGNRKQSREELHIADDTLMIMCTANYNHVKGLDILVNAIATLRDQDKLKNTIVYIVGQTEKDKKELQQRIDELGIPSFMRLEGISNHIPKYLVAADIYVQPSRNEGLPLALMEACSAGLPIVASRIGGIPEVAIEGENATLFEVENVEECASALQRMIEDGALRKRYGEHSKEIFENKFQMATNATKLIEYYDL